MKKKIAIVSGTRPNIVKIAPLLKRHLSSYEHLIDIELFHTGQHYDFSMHGTFFEDFSLPLPDHIFETRDMKTSAQIGAVMTELEKAFESILPDAVLVVGDVNSTLAAALTSSKMGIFLVHLEAGVRSFDMSMTEEQNRVVVDLLADLLLSPTKTAVINLEKQGIPKSSVKLVGNILAESLLKFQQKDSEREDFGLMTLHRPFNVDNEKNLERIISTIGKNTDVPVIFPVHPRTAKNIINIDVPENIRISGPMSYSEFIGSLSKCAFVITDSGGVQTEATILKTPCVTLRKNSEWPETIETGTNVLLEDPSGIKTAIKKASQKSLSATLPPFWDGEVSRRIWESVIAAL